MELVRVAGALGASLDAVNVLALMQRQVLGLHQPDVTVAEVVGYMGVEEALPLYRRRRALILHTSPPAEVCGLGASASGGTEAWLARPSPPLPHHSQACESEACESEACESEACKSEACESEAFLCLHLPAKRMHELCQHAPLPKPPPGTWATKQSNAERLARFLGGSAGGEGESVPGVQGLDGVEICEECVVVVSGADEASNRLLAQVQPSTY
jgi:hypothetical protein